MLFYIALLSVSLISMGCQAMPIAASFIAKKSRALFEKRMIDSSGYVKLPTPLSHAANLLMIPVAFGLFGLAVWFNFN